ncbi:MAG: hypothetical protein HDQ88_07630 [Clostridia bacterium]|nr:hypothetical protein [Clostridia bacterium]
MFYIIAYFHPSFNRYPEGCGLAAPNGSKDDMSWYSELRAIVQYMGYASPQYRSTLFGMSRHRVPKARDEGIRERSERFGNHVVSFRIWPVHYM